MKATTKHLVIVAGEESGDIHAAAFVKKLKSTHPNIHISGIGGQHMQQAGVELISDLARYGVTGATEILRHARMLKRAFKTIQKHLTENRPDLLVLVDYPGFNLRLAKFAKEKLGIRILYYISPQIWAWKAGRIHTIRRYIDRMAVILPFEKPLYEKEKVPVTFVGHPLATIIPAESDVTALRKKLSLPTDTRMIALLPGSRINEIKHHMPVFKKMALQLSAQFNNDLHFAIPVASSIDPHLIENYLQKTSLNYTLIPEKSREVMASSDCVVVASGTASLESALLGKPMCIVYKGALLSYLIASQVIKVKYFGLCNLLANQLIVPELLQYDFTAEHLSQIMTELLMNSAYKQSMLEALSAMRATLSTEEADCDIAQLVWQELNHNPKFGS